MEEKRLRTHLIRIYIVTAAAVLLAVLSAMTGLFYLDGMAKNRERFSALLFAVTDQLRLEYSMSHQSMREIEQKNELSLLFRDNGEKLLFNQTDSAEKQALFARAESLCAADGYDVSTLPLTAARRTSGVYAFRYRGRAYQAAVSIVPFDGGYRSVTMVQRSPAVNLQTALLLVIGYALSLALLSAVGVRLIDRALLPAVESRKRQTLFIAAASHELRSPLAVISANASAARQPENTLAASAAIEAECKRMSHLIGDMLLLASADAKSWPIALGATEADTVLLCAYEVHAPLFRQNGCALTLSLPEEPLPRVLADAERLTQVLGILLDNALCYGMTETCKKAELAAARCGRGVAITVTDHGAGLTKAQKAQVFERFYRGDTARREKQHFGLGLSIARELVQLQNGILAVEDTPGGGCTFRITLFPK